MISMHNIENYLKNIYIESKRSLDLLIAMTIIFNIEIDHYLRKNTYKLQYIQSNKPQFFKWNK